jgi:RNA polymerase sigma-70 factor (ECF subfamily)
MSHNGRHRLLRFGRIDEERSTANALGYLRRPGWDDVSHPSLRLVPSAQADELDDASLVRALASREEWAARVAWNRYAPMVYGLLDRALGSSGESEDLTQEVFLRVFAAIHTLRDPAALRSFIYSSALRMLRWHFRAKRVRRLFALSDSGELPDRASPGVDNEARDLLRRFYRLLDELGANERTAFLLRHVEGLTLDEIGALTGASLATVKRRIRRAADRACALAKGDPELAQYLNGQPAGANLGN